MSGGQPLHYVWWLTSRASGILALILVSVAVLLGLGLAGRSIRRPTIRRIAMSLHEHVAVVSIGAIGLHGLALLGDTWLRPGLLDLVVPFELHFRPAYTGAGIIAGYLVLLLGPSFYLRRRIGARRWRMLHPLVLVAWILALVHTLGTGSDAQQIWLRVIVLAPVVPAAYLGVVRLGSRRAKPKLVTAGAETPARASARPREALARAASR